MASLQPSCLYVSLLKVKATIICTLICKEGGGGVLYVVCKEWEGNL